MQGQAVSVLILAGGRSRRMGQDKLWLTLNGMPLVEHVVRRVLPVAAEVLFSANEPARFEALARGLPVPGRVVPDVFPAVGPLAGLHAGLNAGRCDLLLALAGDMPFVNEALVRQMIALAAGFDAVVPQLVGRGADEPTWEPLHALYRRSCLPAIEARLAAGEHRIASFFTDIRLRPLTTVEILPLDPELRSFFNINTSADWQEAQRLATNP